MNNQLRTLVRGAYDVQKLRIQMGNRIVGNFKVKLGQEPGHAEQELDTTGKKILADLRASYHKITDGVKTFPRQVSFKGEGIISTYTELCLVAQYISLEEHEHEHFGRFVGILKEFPIYTNWLQDVRGVGPAMAGVIISEIDISKAKYVSSLWAYAGLDVVSRWALCGIEFHSCDLDAEKKQEVTEAIPTERPLLDYEGQLFGEPYFGPDYTSLRMAHAGKGYQLTAEYELVGDQKGRSRRKEHLVEVTYTNKKGEEVTRRSITFNPFLKTKLTGVLGPSFLKVKDSPYGKMYYDYKHRLENHVTYKDESKGHRHNMAIRYIVKQFLMDLYVQWRTIEGLPMQLPYSEAKLGLVHQAA